MERKGEATEVKKWMLAKRYTNCLRERHRERKDKKGDTDIIL